MSKIVKLYHGSKSGLRGNILPVSRVQCDFGKGFYMGTNIDQPLTLICNFPESKLYELEIDLDGLSLLNLDIGIDWAMLIAFNRNKMENVKDTPIYNKYKDLTSNKDMIIGHISNDRMFYVLDRFFSGQITDQALIHSLSALELGKQYVAKTAKACQSIHILKELPLDPKMREYLKTESSLNRRKGMALADEICRKYRREGLYFDEILNGEG